MLYDTCAAPSDRRSRALSDDQRVLASQRGYEGFFRATYPPLATQLHAVLGDREQAHQAAIQALRDAARRWNEVGELADPTSWVRQRAATRLRRQATLRMVTNPTAAHIPPSSDIAVLDALLSLPDVQRRALVLTYLARLPIDQVAHEESTTVAAILSRLAHATVELGHRLSRGGGARGDVDVSSGRWATTEIDDWVARQMSYLEYRLTPRPSSEPIPTVSARRWSTNASIGLLTGALAVITVGVGVAAHLRAASEASVVTPRLSATTVTPKLLVPSTAMAAGSHSPDGRAPAAPLPAAQAPAAPAPAAPVPAAPVPAAPVPAAPVPAAPAPAAPAPAAPAPAAPVPTAPAPATPAPATPAPATPAPATSTPARPAPATRAPATRVPSAALAPALPKPAVRAPAARAPVPEAPREAATGRRQAPDRTPAKTVPSDDARTESGTRHREDHDSDHPASRDRRGAPVFEDRPYPDDTREPTFDHRHTPAPRGEPLDRPTPPAEDLPRTGDGDEPWQPSPTAAPSRRPAPYQRARPTPDSTVEPHTPYDPATPSVTPSDPTGEPTVDPAPPVRRHPDGYPHRRPAPDRQGHGGTYDEPGHPERPGRYDGSPSDG